jgi:hypothetical protein
MTMKSGSEAEKPMARLQAMMFALFLSVLFIPWLGRPMRIDRSQLLQIQCWENYLSLGLLKECTNQNGYDVCLGESSRSNHSK